MAKRKRLTPARITADSAAPEIKSAFPSHPNGGIPPRTMRPPIADVAQDASASAALTEIAQTLSDARAQGRLIQHLPLAAIKDDYLVRDRLAVDLGEMEVLMQSIASRGQQTAIEVTALENGEYGLISGWRRVQALRMLATKDPARDTVLAIVRTPQDAAEAYQAMIEENEIRVGLSYFERARIVARAVDAGVFQRDRVALARLFASVSRPKRSKIGSFVRVVRALEDALHFPTQMTERTGLALAQALDAEGGGAARRVREALFAPYPKTPAEEAARIMAALAPPAPKIPDANPAPDRHPASVPALRELRPGLRLAEAAEDRIVLSGAALRDPAFRAALMAFLEKTETE